ncbi:MAG: hypothetical protein M3Y74_23135 [Chloroflexota bacterium]|nr:hypothetical protein [Chloroflexota bacterium]
MVRRLFALLALALALGTASPVLAQSAPACQYILGFATLQSLDPTNIGISGDYPQLTAPPGNG